MTNKEMISFGKEQLEIFGEGSEMHEFITRAVKMAEAFKMIEFNAYVINKELNQFRDGGSKDNGKG